MLKIHTAQWLMALIAIAVAFAIADSRAEETAIGSEEQAEAKSANPDARAAKPESAAETEPMPVFVPCDKDAPFARISGATRGAKAEKIPSIEVIAPERLGYTLDPQPNLYWSLSDATKRGVEIRLTRQDSDPPETVFETQLEGPLEAGLHRFDLARHGFTLEPGVLYMWYVRLDLRSDAWPSGAGIQRVTAASELETELSAADVDRKAFVLAEAGIWYDAIRVLSEQIEDGSASAPAQRAALFEQVGLPTPQ